MTISETCKRVLETIRSWRFRYCDVRWWEPKWLGHLDDYIDGLMDGQRAY